LEKREAEGLSPKTIETWRDFSRAYINPYVGTLPLTRLTTQQVDDLYTTLRQSGRRQSAGRLAPRTVLHVHRLLSEVMKSAVRLKLIPSNPCEDVPLRMEDDPRTVAEQERIAELVRGGGLSRLLAGAEGTWLSLPVLLAFGLGLRRGEVLGLRWIDVDFKAGTLRVEQTVQTLRGGKVVVKAPKSKAGKRTIGLPEFVAVELVQQKARQAAHRLQMGSAWQDAGLVIQQEDTGGPRLPDNLTHAFGKLADRAGIGVLHFHDLRHGNATMLKLAKVDTKVISARLGHSGTQITRDLYEHVLVEMDTDAAQKSDTFLRQALGG
jgi:integrase